MVDREPGRRKTCHPSWIRTLRKRSGAGRKGRNGRRTEQTEAAQAAPGRKPGPNMIFTDLNLIEGSSKRRPGEADPGANPGEEATGTTAGNRRRQTMTTNWKWTETADGAGVEALCAASCVRALPGRRLVRALRWRQDAVCGYAAADADLRDAEPDMPSGGPADFTGSSVTRTFFLIPLSNSTTNPKGTPNTTQKKKGKQTTKTQVTFSQETRNLSLTTKEKKLWQNLKS